ncbi:FAD-dependent thymidylate synthase [bacterium]|nr:FAD-dependent thymidylate synthase [bacterium]
MTTARLISHSALVDGGSMEDGIVYCARVSNPASQHANLNNHRLIRYLIEHRHWSPFEMTSLCLEVETTRDIARQLLRHRSFSFQEFSQRYAAVTEPPVVREARLQDHTNRQNSLETDDEPLRREWTARQEEVSRVARETYEWALENGIAREQARAVLPEGNTASRLYVNGTLRSWIHYIELRSDPGTQKEHRALALACAEAIRPVFPLITTFVSA